MPRVSKDQKEFYKARIRSLLVVDHNASLREIQERLEKIGLRLDKNYILKLRDAVLKERTLRADRKTLNQALSVVEDTLTETVRLAWQVALSQSASNKDKLRAMAEIRKSHIDMFNLLFDAGIFNRKIGTLEHEIRNTKLSDEQKKNIRGAFEKWGLIKAPDNESTNNTTTQ